MNINPSEAILMNRMLNRNSSTFTFPDSILTPYKTFINSKREFSGLGQKSNDEIFDSKIATLNKAKNKAVEEEDYIEAEKLKQIILKIDKLKAHVNNLESKKIEYANVENYEQAKRVKNEINRIRNIVLSVSAGSSTSRPRIIPPLKNAQTMAEQHNRKVNRSLFNLNRSVKTKQSYENFRSSHKEASYSYFNLNKLNKAEDADEVVEFTSQRSLTNLKSTGYQKRTGILKFNTGVYNSNNISVMEDVDPGVTSTAELTMVSPDVIYQNEPFHRTAKKQVRVEDPKFRIVRKTSSASEQSSRQGKRENVFSPFIPKNADNRVVPGALMKRPIDFSKVMEEKKGQDDDKSLPEIEEIDPSEAHKAEPYFQFFEKKTIKNLFSKRWQNKEEGYRTMTEEIKNLIDSTVNDMNSGNSGKNANQFQSKKKDCYKLVYDSVERGLNDKIVHIRMRA
jgi:hypothetical protein